jgi:hypothetical protein
MFYIVATYARHLVSEVRLDQLDWIEKIEWIKKWSKCWNDYWPAKKG